MQPKVTANGYALDLPLVWKAQDAGIFSAAPDEALRASSNGGTMISGKLSGLDISAQSPAVVSGGNQAILPESMSRIDSEAFRGSAWKKTPPRLMQASFPEAKRR